MKRKTAPRLATLIFLLLPSLANAGGVFGCPPPGAPKAAARAPRGGTAWVHPQAVAAMTCVLRQLDALGVRIVPAYLGGYGCRPYNRSWHPLGLAIDVNQHARNVTDPYIPPQLTVQAAEACGVTSGAVWRYSPDNGHFEMRSASRSVQSRRGYRGYRYYRRRHHYRYPSEVNYRYSPYGY